MDAYNRQKDMLAIMVAVFVTVPGWYFGRVPAEKQADAAKQEAENAKKAEEKTKEIVCLDLGNLRRATAANMRGYATSDLNARIDDILAKLDRL